MVRVDVYLKKVGAWTMEEVYETPAWQNWTNGLRRRKSRLPTKGRVREKTQRTSRIGID